MFPAMDRRLELEPDADFDAAVVENACHVHMAGASAVLVVLLGGGCVG